jgi:hypothetical protein
MSRSGGKKQPKNNPFKNHPPSAGAHAYMVITLFSLFQEKSDTADKFLLTTGTNASI